MNKYFCILVITLTLTKLCTASQQRYEFESTRLYNQSAILSSPEAQQLIERARRGETSPEITRLQDSLVIHFRGTLASELRRINICKATPIVLQFVCIGGILAGSYMLFGKSSPVTKTLFLTLPMLHLNY